MNKITITTSIELSKEEKENIVTRLKKKYGEAEYIFHVDYELIGGIIIFDGEKVFDGSLRTQLKTFREKLNG